MRNIWLISDTHFFHSNILTFEDDEGNLIRGSRFSTIEEMNELIVDSWGSTVKDGDIVYHLGDLYFSNLPKMRTLMPKLPGRKRLIVGNHDDIKVIAKEGWFQKIQMWRMFPEFGLLLSHVPVHEQSLTRHDRYLTNVHGHIHEKPVFSDRYINVSVEATDYKLINIEELSETKQEMHKVRP